ncbi:MAG: hypothetical protein JWN29_1366, partial [Acidimicrobiales bacterium]|nr:hypothetical protein [Acidimicrobiales bacterium]
VILSEVAEEIESLVEEETSATSGSSRHRS